MLLRSTLIIALCTAAGLCSTVVPKTNPVQNTTLFLYIRESTYPQNYDSDPVGLCAAGENAGQAICALNNYNISFPTFTFVPDDHNIGTKGANSGILIYEGEGNSNVQTLSKQAVTTSGTGSEFLPGGSNTQNLYVGGGSGSTPVSFYYNFQSGAFGVVTQPRRNGPKVQLSQFFVCLTIYQGQEPVQVPNLVFTPTGSYPGQACENVTLIAST